MTEGNLRKSVSFTKILLLTSVPSLYVTLACSVWLVLACRDDMVKLSSSFWKIKNSLEVNFSSRLIIGMFISIYSYEVIRLGYVCIGLDVRSAAYYMDSFSMI